LIQKRAEMGPDKSLEAVVWCAVGGRGSLVGPVLGAVGVNALKSYATHAFAEQWPYILGLLFVFVTLCLPKGIVGLPEQWRTFRSRRFPKQAPIEMEPVSRSATPGLAKPAAPE